MGGLAVLAGGAGLEQKQIELKKKRKELRRIERKAEALKSNSTIDLKNYLRSQVRPDLLACPRG